MSTLLRLSLPLLILGASSGCIIVIEKEHVDEWPDRPHDQWPDTGEPVDSGAPCTEEARASVVVDIVDASGAPLSGAAVTYAGPDGVIQEAQCVDEACTQLVAGWEIEGEIALTASLRIDTEDPCCWYEDVQELVVEVPLTADGCHVETQRVSITLDPSQLVCADAEEACG